MFSEALIKNQKHWKSNNRKSMCQHNEKKNEIIDWKSVNFISIGVDKLLFGGWRFLCVCVCVCLGVVNLYSLDWSQAFDSVGHLVEAALQDIAWCSSLSQFYHCSLISKNASSFDRGCLQKTLSLHQSPPLITCLNSLSGFKWQGQCLHSSPLQPFFLHFSGSYPWKGTPCPFRALACNSLETPLTLVSHAMCLGSYPLKQHRCSPAFKALTSLLFTSSWINISVLQGHSKSTYKSFKQLQTVLLHGSESQIWSPAPLATRDRFSRSSNDPCSNSHLVLAQSHFPSLTLSPSPRRISTFRRWNLFICFNPSKTCVLSQWLSALWLKEGPRGP